MEIEVSKVTTYWAILEHIVTGLRYFSFPYEDPNKFSPGEIVCDIDTREYLVIGWTTIKPDHSLIDVFQCNVWDD